MKSICAKEADPSPPIKPQNCKTMPILKTALLKILIASLSGWVMLELL